jgi:dienelactone hydrolase
MKSYPPIVLALLALVALADAAGAVQLDQLPRPTGPFAIGTTTRQWTDTTRTEPFTGDPHDKRTVDVFIWYPAALNSARAPTPYVPYVDEAERLVGADYANHVRVVRTNATIDPAISPQQDPFPLVVFSHGLGSSPAHYTMLAEELASQGFVVASINHRFGSAVTLQRRQPPQGLHARWRSAFAITQEAERFWADGITQWAGDIIFVINQLRDESGVATNFFGNRIDMSAVVVAGHSHGGASALFAAQLDQRVRAVVNLDGTARSIHAARPMRVPVLWMQQDRSMMDSAQAARTLRATPRGFTEFMTYLDANQDTVMGGAPPGSHLAVVGRTHRDHFSDLSLVFGESAGASGFIAPERALDIVRTYVVSFLAVQLGRAGPATLERLGRRYPEVAVSDGRK